MYKAMCVCVGGGGGALCRLLKWLKLSGTHLHIFIKVGGASSAAVPVVMQAL